MATNIQKRGNKALRESYRPHTFSEFWPTCNTETVRRLLSGKSHSHVFLLQGPAGTGKTTMARIMARRINCQTPTNAGDPCLKCDNCQHYEWYTREENMADKTGIDATRDLITDIIPQPLDDRKLVLILDEAHRLTEASQSAWLKALEDPPEHLYVILCTMEPEKFIKALYDRCSKINFQLLQQTAAVDLIQQVVKTEGKDIPVATANKMFQDIGGCPREILNAAEEFIYTGSYTLASPETETETKLSSLIFGILKSGAWDQVMRDYWRLVQTFPTPDSMRVSVAKYVTKIVQNPTGVNNIEFGGSKCMLFLQELDTKVEEPLSDTWFLVRLYRAWAAIKNYKKAT